MFLEIVHDLTIDTSYFNDFKMPIDSEPEKKRQRLSQSPEPESSVSSLTIPIPEPEPRPETATIIPIECLPSTSKIFTFQEIYEENKSELSGLYCEWEACQHRFTSDNELYDHVMKVYKKIAVIYNETVLDAYRDTQTSGRS